ncbi:hypothetical protein N7523_010214 [Penicillium sp. IBT 18751x]|nr:hypothetical protein N7523_010214 [Penicillium sp. IBT 18751x]
MTVSQCPPLMVKILNEIMQTPSTFIDMAVISALKAFRASRSTSWTIPCAQKAPAATDYISVKKKTDKALERILCRLSDFDKNILSLLKWEFDQSITWEASDELVWAFKSSQAMPSQAKMICECEYFWIEYSKQTCSRLTYKEFSEEIQFFWNYLELLFKI